MKEVISGITNISPEDISIKATTTEKLGFAGREEGLAAFAIVLLEKSGNSPTVK
jgi:2-C-methyl-D-erythritol 2,4-cyclodiphosphate synthase